MRYIIFVVTFIMYGCSSTYNLVEDQNFSTTVGSDIKLIRWVRLPFSELQETCKELTKLQLSPNEKMLGCAEHPTDRICTVYTATDTTHQILGHEVRHCFQGKFHK